MLQGIDRVWRKLRRQSRGIRDRQVERVGGRS